MISMFYPYIPREGIDAVAEVLASRWIGQGPKVDAFEARFSEYVHTPYCLTLSSCTAALHLALVLAKVGEKDEVITTALTCAATNEPILQVGARAVFADIQADTLNIDPKDIERKISSNTKAIMVVHFGGIPCDMDEIHALAKRHNLIVIEDAAHALGASYKKKKIGSLSDYTCFSFQAIKHITTGDGGMLTCRTQDKYEEGKRRRWFGIDRNKRGDLYWSYDIHEQGYKYHMNDIAAALGLVQMDHLEPILNKKRELATIYDQELKSVPGIELLKIKADRQSAYWLYTIKVSSRDAFMKKLKSEEIESSLVHIRSDLYTLFGGKRQELPVLDEIEPKYVSIPIHSKLSTEEVWRVTSVIKAGW